MRNLLWVIVVVLIILWAVGFLGFHAGGFIHILLVIALIVIVIKLVQGKKIF